MAIVDDRPTLFIREQESNTNQDAEQVCKIYHGAFFSYRGVRFDVGLPNPNTPYDFAFNKTSTHRGITQNMRTAPQRRIRQPENRTAVWCYIVATRANKHRLSSSRVSELVFSAFMLSQHFAAAALFYSEWFSACPPAGDE